MTRRSGRMLKRNDPNHAEIVTVLRSVGCTVVDLGAVGNGVPDLIVGYRGRNYLIEIKAPDDALRENQRAWHASWRGQVAVARTTDEALRVVGQLCHPAGLK